MISPNNDNYISPTRNLHADYIPGISNEKIINGRLTKTEKLKLAEHLLKNPENEKLFLQNVAIKKIANESQKLQLANNFIDFKAKHHFQSLNQAAKSDTYEHRKVELSLLFELDDKSNVDDLAKNFISQAQQAKTPVQPILSQLKAQSNTIPIINQAIQEISYSYNQDRKENLGNQHLNLIVLSKWCADPNNHAQSIAPDSLNLIIDFLQGTKTLTPEILNNAAFLKTSVETPAQPSQIKPNSKITPDALQQEMKLLETVKLTHQVIKDSQELMPTSSGNALVYKIEAAPVPIKNSITTPVPAKNEPNTAYMKMAKDQNDDASARFEKIAFRVAETLGLGASFAPTRFTSVEVDRVEKEKTTALKMKATASEKPAARENVSLQVGINGKTFHLYVKGKSNWSDIPRSELNKGILTAAVFGMYDLNQTNVIVTPKGELKFFDNTRSNWYSTPTGFIRNSHVVFGTTRNVLLAHPEAYQPLTQQDINAMKLQVAELKRHLPELEVLMQSKTFRMNVDKLPPHWMDVQNSFQGFSQRINALEQALNATKIVSGKNLGPISCARDISMVADPMFKFSALMTALQIKTPETEDLEQYDELRTIGKMNLLKRGYISPEQSVEIQQKVLSNAGYFKLKQMISFCREQGINPYDLLAIAKNPNLSFDDMLMSLAKLCKIASENPKNLEQKEMHVILCKQFMNEIVEASPLNFTDNSDSDETIAIDMLYDHLDRHNIPFFFTLNSKVQEKFEKKMGELEPYEHIFKIEENPPESDPLYVVKMIYKDEKGNINIQEVDFTSSPGKIDIDGKSLSPAEYIKKNTPPYYFGTLSNVEVNFLFQKAPADRNYFALVTDKSTGGLELIKKIRSGDHLIRESLIPTRNPGIYRSQTGAIYNLAELPKKLSSMDYAPLPR